jgi:hypothetical protein
MVYLPTKLGDFVRANVGKYSSTISSTMEHGVSLVSGMSFPHFLFLWDKPQMTC